MMMVVEGGWVEPKLGTSALRRRRRRRGGEPLELLLDAEELSAKGALAEQALGK